MTKVNLCQEQDLCKLTLPHFNALFSFFIFLCLAFNIPKDKCSATHSTLEELLFSSFKVWSVELDGKKK